MAKYRVTAPDGTKYDVTAPDDAKQEDILEFAQQQHEAIPPKEPDVSRETVSDNPRFDTPGDIKRAASASYDALKRNAKEAFDPNVAAQESVENRKKYGAVGGFAKDALVDPVARLGNAASVPMDALGILSSPATGLMHSSLGSLLSLVPGLKQPKKQADEMLDTSLMGLGPEAGGEGVLSPEFQKFREADVAKATEKANQKAYAQDPELSARMKAIDKVNKRAAADKLTPQQVLDAQLGGKSTNDPVTLMDVGGKNVKGLAGNVYRSGGEAGGDLKTFLENRAKKNGTTMKEEIGRLAKGSSYQTVKELQKSRSEKARPLFDAAYAVKVDSPYLQRLFDNPRVRAGINRGLKIERDEADGENRPFVDADYAVTGYDEKGDPIISKTPTMKLWAVAKEGLDAMISEAVHTDGPSMGQPTKEGVALRKLKKGLLGELHKENPAYETATNSWAGDSGSINAVNDGRSHFSRNETTEQVKAEFDALSPSEKEFYRMGAAEDAISRLEVKEKGLDTDNDRNLADAVIRNKRDRDRWNILFPDQKSADRFLASATRKSISYQTKGKIMGGSQTAERSAEDANGLLENGLNAAKMVGHAKTGNIAGLVRGISDAYQSRQLKKNPQIAAEMAKLLKNPNLILDPNGSAVLPPVDYKPMLKRASPEDIKHTAEKYGISEEQVKQQLGIQ